METMVMKNWERRGGHTMCIIMVSVKMVNKISRSLRTNRYKLYPNRLNRLKRVQKLLRLKSSLKNDTNNRNVQFSQVNCKLDRCSTLSVSLFDTLKSKKKLKVGHKGVCEVTYKLSRCYFLALLIHFCL